MHYNGQISVKIQANQLRTAQNHSWSVIMAACASPKHSTVEGALLWQAALIYILIYKYRQTVVTNVVTLVVARAYGAAVRWY